MKVIRSKNNDIRLTSLGAGDVFSFKDKDVVLNPNNSFCRFEVSYGDLFVHCLPTWSDAQAYLLHIETGQLFSTEYIAVASKMWESGTPSPKVNRFKAELKVYD